MVHLIAFSHILTTDRFPTKIILQKMRADRNLSKASKMSFHKKVADESSWLSKVAGCGKIWTDSPKKFSCVPFPLRFCPSIALHIWSLPFCPNLPHFQNLRFHFFVWKSEIGEFEVDTKHRRRVEIQSGSIPYSGGGVQSPDSLCLSTNSVKLRHKKRGKNKTRAANYCKN